MSEHEKDGYTVLPQGAKPLGEDWRGAAASEIKNMLAGRNGGAKTKPLEGDEFDGGVTVLPHGASPSNPGDRQKEAKKVAAEMARNHKGGR